MTRLLLPVFLIALAAPIYLSAQTSEELPTVLQAGNRIAAKVEGTIITVEEIRREMAPLMRQVYSGSKTTEEFHANIRGLTREVLQNLVDRILIVKDFREKEFQIPKSFIEGEFNRVIQEDFEGDRSRFLSFLRSQDQTVRDFRAELEKKIIVDVMRQQMRRSQAEISPDKIESFYLRNLPDFERNAAVKLRQIVLIPKRGETPNSLAQRMREAEAALESGEEFAAVARRFSEDAMASRGGLYGWLERKDLRPDLGEIAFSLQSGERSQSIITPEAAFILFVEEKRPAGPQPLHEVRDQIERAILDELAREAQIRWIERLRQKAFVEYYI
ncbi:MAG: peptidyl-prolyl cis-trans isomerase [Puniceicoccaceae bacterium]